MIRRLGELTRKTADSLQGSQGFTVQGVELTGQASAVLAAITVAMERVESTGRSIDEAATAQYAMARQVDDAVEQVARVVEQNAEECLRLQAASGSLQQMGASLGAAVGVFRAARVAGEPLRA
jgi:methyl-accepting chemotaxis protein